MPNDLPIRPSSQPCRTCANWKRTCSWLLGASFSGSELHCDWEPSRYRVEARDANLDAAGRVGE